MTRSLHTPGRLERGRKGDTANYIHEDESSVSGLVAVQAPTADAVGEAFNATTRVPRGGQVRSSDPSP